MAEHGWRDVTGMGLAGGAALVLGGYTPAQAGRSRPSATPMSSGHFASFAGYIPMTLEIHTGPGRLGRRTPGITISPARWVMQGWQEKREALPPQNRLLWVHGVMTLGPAGGRTLVEASSGKVGPLPGTYPDLRQYVPEGRIFTTIPKEKVGVILGIEYMVQDDPNRFKPPSFDTEHVAIYADVNPPVLIVRE